MVERVVVVFWIEGHPNTNHRARRKGDQYYMDKDYLAWRDRVGYAALAARVPDYGKQKVILALRVFTKSHAIQDFDNLGKCIAEGLGDVANAGYDNDNRVYLGIIGKHPPHPVKGEGVEALIMPLEGYHTPTDMQSQALSILASGHRVPTEVIAFQLWGDYENLSGVRNLMSRLRKAGHEIDCQRGKGYQLITYPERTPGP